MITNAKMRNSNVDQVCAKYWPLYKSDCSGFVRAVADDLGVKLTGQANNIVTQIQKSPWTSLKQGAGKQAKLKAEAGYLVIGGLQKQSHGHVVVVVPGPLDRDKYPTAYWGKLGGAGKSRATVNFAWLEEDRDQVIYAYISVSSDPLSDVLSEARRASSAVLL